MTIVARFLGSPKRYELIKTKNARPAACVCIPSRSGEDGGRVHVWGCSSQSGGVVRQRVRCAVSLCRVRLTSCCNMVETDYFCTNLTPDISVSTCSNGRPPALPVSIYFEFSTFFVCLSLFSCGWVCRRLHYTTAKLKPSRGRVGATSVLSYVGVL